jgi:hypothetical protein
VFVVHENIGSLGILEVVTTIRRVDAFQIQVATSLTGSLSIALDFATLTLVAGRTIRISDSDMVQAWKLTRLWKCSDSAWRVFAADLNRPSFVWECRFHVQRPTRLHRRPWCLA